MGAEEYAEHIDRLLNSCEYLEPRRQFPARINIPPDNALAFEWRKARIIFKGGKALNILDLAIFDTEGNMTERRFSYDFRTINDDHPIFRICNHQEWNSVDAPCHVHVTDGNEKTGERIIECFSDSKGFPADGARDFSYAIHCIKNFYLGRRQEWEMEEDSDSIL